MITAQVCLRHLATHRLRTLSTIGGIALGVAAFVGIRLVSEAASKSFRKTVDGMAGKAVLQIANGEAGIPETLLDEVKATPGVTVAAPSVQGFVALPDLAGERLYVLGVDLLADHEPREYRAGNSQVAVEDPLVFLAQPDSVALTADFATRHGLETDERLRVLATNGVTELVVRAILGVRTNQGGKTSCRRPALRVLISIRRRPKPLPAAS